MIGNITFKCRYCGKSLNSGKHKQLLCKKKHQKMLDMVVKKNMKQIKKIKKIKNTIVVEKLILKLNEIIKTLNLLSEALNNLNKK